MTNMKEVEEGDTELETIRDVLLTNYDINDKEVDSSNHHDNRMNMSANVNAGRGRVVRALHILLLLPAMSVQGVRDSCIGPHVRRLCDHPCPHVSMAARAALGRLERVLFDWAESTGWSPQAIEEACQQAQDKLKLHFSNLLCKQKANNNANPMDIEQSSSQAVDSSKKFPSYYDDYPSYYDEYPDIYVEYPINTSPTKISSPYTPTMPLKPYSPTFPLIMQVSSHTSPQHKPNDEGTSYNVGSQVHHSQTEQNQSKHVSFSTESSRPHSPGVALRRTSEKEKSKSRVTIPRRRGRGGKRKAR